MAALVEFARQWPCPCLPVTVQLPARGFARAVGAGPFYERKTRVRGSQEWHARSRYKERCDVCWNFRYPLGHRRKPLSRIGSISGGKLWCLNREGELSLHGFEARASSDETLSQNEAGRLTEEAREAVATVLLEAGLSQGDAEGVVAGAPVFIRELAGCVEELTEEEEESLDETESSRDRILRVARHGRGMSPLLESVGVHLPSVSKTSRSLSSVRPPQLLQKVRYIEELLTVDEPQERPVDGLCQYMLKNLSVSIWDDEGIQRTLAFFEKMKERGVRALEDSTVPLLVEAFPQIFKRSLEHQIMPVVRFLKDLGIESKKLAKVLVCYPSILLQDPETDLLPRKRALKKVGIRVEDMGKMVIKYPWVLSKCVGNNVDTLVQFLESIKVPKSKIDWSITRCPQLLGCSCTGTLEPRVHHMKGYGIQSRRLGRALAQSPELLIHTTEEFDAVVFRLGSVGVESYDISKLLRRSPEILGFDIEGTLQKKINFLTGLGLHQRRLSRIITFFPEMLSMSVDNSLLPRIQYLREWGFNEQEIRVMVFSFPPLLGYNAQAILTPKLEFLTQTMKRSVQDVVAYPRYFSYSLEKRIRPRARVLANRQIQCTLRAMLAKSDAQFAAEFLGFESMLIPRVKSS